MNPKYHIGQTVTFKKKDYNYLSKIENAFKQDGKWIYKLKHHNESIYEDSILEVIQDETEKRILELDNKLTTMADNARQVADVTIKTLTDILKDIQSTLKELKKNNEKNPKVDTGSEG